MDTYQQEIYKLNKHIESLEDEKNKLETEARRHKEQQAIFTDMKESMTKKLNENKEKRQKQTEMYQQIVHKILTSILSYKRYIDASHKSIVSSYENILLMVDYRFDGLRESMASIEKIDMDSKHLKLLNIQSQCILSSLNDDRVSIDTTSLDQMYNKIVKDMRGRKLIDDKESEMILDTTPIVTLNQPLDSNHYLTQQPLQNNNQLIIILLSIL